MLRSELIHRLSEEFPHLTFREIEQSVVLFFEELTRQLEKGERIELRGLGSWSVREYNARTGRNPMTREAVDVEATKRVHFKASKSILERLNPKK